MIVVSIAVDAIPVRAQGSSLDSSAASIAAIVSKEKHSTVVVCDFVGGRAQLTALGVQVGDDLSAAVVRAAGSSFRVVDRAQYVDTLHGLGLEREAANGRSLQQIVAEKLKANYFLSGRLQFRSNYDLLIEIRLYRSGENRAPQSFEALEPRGGGALNLFRTPFKDTPQSTVPFANINGYTEAKCIFCPTPAYPMEAKRLGAQGTVIVLAVVGADGKLSHYRVLQDAPAGLDEAVIQGLDMWRLIPANDPSGAPVAVRQTFQVSYSLQAVH